MASVHFQRTLAVGHWCIINMEYVALLCITMIHMQGWWWVAGVAGSDSNLAIMFLLSCSTGQDEVSSKQRASNANVNVKLI